MRSTAFWMTPTSMSWRRTSAADEACQSGPLPAGHCRGKSRQSQPGGGAGRSGCPRPGRFCDPAGDVCVPLANCNFRPNAEEAGGATVQFLSNLAKYHGLYLVAGSIPELNGGKVYNTSYFFDRNGRVLGKHQICTCSTLSFRTAAFTGSPTPFRQETTSP